MLQYWRTICEDQQLTTDMICKLKNGDIIILQKKKKELYKSCILWYGLSIFAHEILF